MSIGVGKTDFTSAAAFTAAAKATEKKPVEDEKIRTDTVTVSKDFYAKSKLTAEDSKKVEILKQEMEKQTEEFKTFIQSMIAKQGEKANFTLGKLKLHVTAEDSLKAKAAVSEGGEFSPTAVADRIMDMAKALSGGDPSKIALLKGAVEKGFKAAGVELGVKKLPDVSLKTYDMVMSRFDDWEAGKESE